MNSRQYSILPCTAGVLILSLFVSCILDNPSKPVHEDGETIYPQYPDETEDGKNDITIDTLEQNPLDLLVTKVSSSLESIRDLQFTSFVSSRVYTRQQLRDAWSNAPEEGYEKTDFYTPVLRQLTYLRRSNGVSDYDSAEADYYGNAVAAFYVASTDSVYLVVGSAEDTLNLDWLPHDTLQSINMAHELTHALQDMHFDAFSKDTSVYYTTDYYYAQKCLTEGDAKLTEWSYYGKEFTDIVDPISRSVTILKHLAEAYLDTMTYRNSSSVDFLVMASLIPYRIGPWYVGRVYESSGWKGVNALYAARPTSTAEVMDFRNRGDYSFDMAAIRGYIGQASYWIEDRFGPLFLHILVRRFGKMNEVARNRLVDSYGWKGDWFSYRAESTDSPGHFVWATAFETANDAGVMHSLLDSLLSSRNEDLYRPPLLTRINRTEFLNANVKTYEYTDYSSHLVLLGSEVWWIENVSRDEEILQWISANRKSGGAAKTTVFRPRAKNPLHRWLEKHKHEYPNRSLVGYLGGN